MKNSEQDCSQAFAYVTLYVKNVFLCKGILSFTIFDIK